MSEQSLGEFEELVLLLVAVHNKEAYGVLLQDELKNRMNRSVNISAIHVVLKRLESKGFVESSFGGITKERGGRRKKYYAVTATGKTALDRQYELRTHIYQLIPTISFDK